MAADFVRGQDVEILVSFSTLLGGSCCQYRYFTVYGKYVWKKGTPEASQEVLMLSNLLIWNWVYLSPLQIYQKWKMTR